MKYAPLAAGVLVFPNSLAEPQPRLWKVNAWLLHGLIIATGGRKEKSCLLLLADRQRLGLPSTSRLSERALN
jgi:hypothetical protein